MLFRKSDQLLLSVRERNVLHYYLFTYFLVLCIPLLIVSTYCIHAVSVISRDDLNKNETELLHAASLVDTMLDNFSDLGDSLAINSQVNSFKRTTDPFASLEVYQMIELQKTMPDLFQINQALFDYFVFFDQSEMVVNSRIAYSYEDFYKLYLHKQEYKSFEEWYQQIKHEKPSRGIRAMEPYVYRGNQTINLLSYTSPLSNASGTDNSSIQIYFTADTMETLMPIGATDSIQYIEDYKGDTIYHRAPDGSDLMDVKQLINTAFADSEQRCETVRLQGEKYVAVRYVSQESGLTYCTLKPESAISGRKISNVVAVFTLILLSVTVGVLLSIHLSRKSATPINDMLKEIEGLPNHVEGFSPTFSGLKKTFRDLVHVNTSLNQAMDEQKPYIKNALFNLLINGNYATEEEILKTVQYIGLSHRQQAFWIVIFRFLPQQEDVAENSREKQLSSYTISLEEIVRKLWSDRLFAILGEERAALLLSIPQQEKEGIRAKTEQTIQEIRKMMPTQIAESMLVYAGSVVDSLFDVHESYYNASFLFHQERPAADSAVIWYLPSEGIPAFPSADLAVKLTHYVMTGDIEALRTALKKIMQQYILEGKLPPYLQQMLLNELQMILFRILGKIQMKEEEYRRYYAALEENGQASLLNQITITINLYEKICRYMEEQKRLPDTEKLVHAILAYIDLNFQDGNLSLTGVADLFDLNESHLSLMFKQSYGTNFSAYVEQVRLNKAKELLHTTNLAVNQIAEQVGYYSANSFCRAFRRVTGMSASTYRNSGENEKMDR